MLDTAAPSSSSTSTSSNAAMANRSPRLRASHAELRRTSLTSDPPSVNPSLSLRKRHSTASLTSTAASSGNQPRNPPLPGGDRNTLSTKSSKQSLRSAKSFERPPWDCSSVNWTPPPPLPPLNRERTYNPKFAPQPPQFVGRNKAPVASVVASVFKDTEEATGMTVGLTSSKEKRQSKSMRSVSSPVPKSASLPTCADYPPVAPPPKLWKLPQFENVPSRVGSLDNIGYVPKKSAQRSSYIGTTSPTAASPTTASTSGSKMSRPATGERRASRSRSRPRTATTPTTPTSPLPSAKPTVTSPTVKVRFSGAPKSVASSSGTNLRPKASALKNRHSTVEPLGGPPPPLPPRSNHRRGRSENLKSFDTASKGSQASSDESVTAATTEASPPASDGIEHGVQVVRGDSAVMLTPGADPSHSDPAMEALIAASLERQAYERDLEDAEDEIAQALTAETTLADAMDDTAVSLA